MTLNKSPVVLRHADCFNHAFLYRDLYFAIAKQSGSCHCLVPCNGYSYKVTTAGAPWPHHSDQLAFYNKYIAPTRKSTETSSTSTPRSRRTSETSAKERFWNSSTMHHLFGKTFFSSTSCSISTLVSSSLKHQRRTPKFYHQVSEECGVFGWESRRRSWLRSSKWCTMVSCWFSTCLRRCLLSFVVRCCSKNFKPLVKQTLLNCVVGLHFLVEEQFRPLLLVFMSIFT